MNDVGSMLQTVTPGNWGIILTLASLGVGWLVKEWRETRKMTSEERLARREGFAHQVELLMGNLREVRAENRGLLADLHALRKEYDEHRKLCHLEMEQLRNQLISAQNEIEGLKRRAAQDALEISRMRGTRYERGENSCD